MSKSILDNLADFRKTLDEYHVLYESDPTITLDELSRLDALSAKISRLQSSLDPTSNRRAAGDGNGSAGVFAKSQFVNRADAPPPATNGPPPSSRPAPKTEIKVEVGKGAVKGSFVISLEHAPVVDTVKDGPAGATLDDSAWKILQEKSTIKLNGLAAKAEAKLMRGETDFEVLDGLSVALEVAAGKMDVSTDKGLEVSLMTITLKLIGDVTHWLSEWKEINRKDIKLKAEGRLQVALGSIPELKKKLAALAASQADELKHAKRIDELTDWMDDLKKKRDAVDKQIEKLKSGPHDSKALKHLEDQRKVYTDSLRNSGDELKATTRKLNKANYTSYNLRGKVTGKFGSAVTKLMATKTAQLVGRILLKAIPIVNILSTIIDVAGLLKDLFNLFSRYKGDGAEGDADGEGDKGKGPGARDSKGPVDGPITSPSQVDKPDGPVTRPSQVDGTLRPKPTPKPEKTPVGIQIQFCGPVTDEPQCPES